MSEVVDEIDMEGAEKHVNPDKDIERADGHKCAKVSLSSGLEGSTSTNRPRNTSVTIPVDKWRLDEGIWVDEPGRSMTAHEICNLRKNWIIPSSVTLRPVAEGESAGRPPAGLIAVHEGLFKHGFTLPLPGWVQYILSTLNFPPGQLSPNAWRQLLGMFVLWHYSGQEWPSVNEVLACYRPSYSMKKACGGIVSLNARAVGTVVEDLPTSQAYWRQSVCFAGGSWEYVGKMPPGRVPNSFQPIGPSLAD